MRPTALSLLPIALLLASAGGAVHADPATITLQGRAPLQATCPQAEALLQDALEGPVMRLREEGAMQVSFVVTGQRISDVQASAGPSHYRSRVRQAVALLRCQGADQTAQQHQFTINFTHS